MMRHRVFACLFCTLFACAKAPTGEVTPEAAPAPPVDDVSATFDVDRWCAGADACSCDIRDPAALAANANATLVPNQVWQPQVWVQQGARVGQASPVKVQWQLQAGAESFALQDGHVTAQATAGQGVLVAQVGDFVQCRVGLTNLGAAPDDARVRFRVVDRRSGAPVPGATVVVSQAGQVSAPQAVDAAGVAVSAAALAGAYDVTVFAAGYDYLSLVGLQADGGDVLLPVAGRSDAARGGFSGRVDYNDYEQLTNAGKRRAVRLAMVGGSVNLARLFDLRPNGNGLQDFATDQQLGCDPNDRGCYTLLTNSGSRSHMLPGNLVLDVVLPVKTAFDAVSSAGEHFPWALGVELRKDVATELMDLPVQAWQGEPGKLQALVERGLEVVAAMGAGVHGAVALTPIAPELWQQYTTPKDLARRPQVPQVPLLDAVEGGVGALRLQQTMSQFTDVTLQPLADRLDAVLVLTGTEAPGFGLVPGGLGFGLDSTADGSFVGDGVYDGHINGVALCGSGVCPPGTPARLDDDHVPLFWSQPVVAGEPITVVLAASLQDMMDTMTNTTLAGQLVRGTPTSERLAGIGFLPVPTPQGLVERTYTWRGNSDAESHWVRFELGSGAQWEVWLNGDATAFVAPNVPAGWEDLGDAPTVTHTALQWNGTNLQTLAAGQSASLANFAESVQAFALRRGPLGTF